MYFLFVVLTSCASVSKIPPPRKTSAAVNGVEKHLKCPKYYYMRDMVSDDAGVAGCLVTGGHHVSAIDIDNPIRAITLPLQGFAFLWVITIIF